MSKVSAVILAAGAARRFGRPKQLEHWPDPTSPTLVEHALRLALQTTVAEIIVVTGNQAEAVSAVITPYISPESRPIKLVYNERWADGQGFSVAAGVGAIAEFSSAALFILADQPRLHPATPQALIDYFEQWSETGEAIIFTFNGKRGNPALFGRPFFAELSQLQGDSGGREIVRNHPAAVTELFVDDPAIHEDIDTPEDLERMKEQT